MSGIDPNPSAARRALLWGPAADALTPAREALAASEWQVQVASPALPGREELARERPNLVMLDARSGSEAPLALLRELGEAAGPRVPVLVLAPRGDAGLAEAAWAAGAADVLSDPQDWALLPARALAALASARQLERLRRDADTLRHAQHLAGVGSFELHLETGELRLSAAACELFGMSPEPRQLNVEGFLARIPDFDRESLGRSVREAVEGGGRFLLQHRYHDNDGSLRLIEQSGEAFPDGDKGTWVRGMVRDVTEQRETEKRFRRMANFDSLTGLANRQLFVDHVRAAVEHAGSRNLRMALLHLDLDQFKRVNDTLGHTVGDALLQRLGEVLRSHVRERAVQGRGAGDTDAQVARIGGDEFAVLLSPVDGQQEAADVAERVLRALAEPIVVGSREVSTTASVGIAMFPDDASTAEGLMRQADTAMYHAKRRGRANHQFFKKAMGEAALRRYALEGELRHALERGELSVAYQPRVEMATRRVRGAEALLRWDHPELGSVQPKEFIPVAEETGLIVPIGVFVLETACRQMQAWRQAGFGELCVSVNVSSHQFTHDDVWTRVTEALRASGLPPKRLELEITESLMLQAESDPETRLRDLRGIGVSIALDDFGTGYSSLAYVTRLPLDAVKLDRSIVRDVDSDPAMASVARAVVAMAHTLGIHVVAEGVDSESQAEMLKQLRCEEMQGFLVAGALPPDEFEQFLRDPRRT